MTTTNNSTYKPRSKAKNLSPIKNVDRSNLASNSNMRVQQLETPYRQIFTLLLGIQQVSSMYELYLETKLAVMSISEDPNESFLTDSIDVPL